MIMIGRVCVKTVGRDAGKIGVIVDIIDENHVLIDGNVRRRKCNLSHLVFLDNVVKIKTGAGHEEVKKAMKDAGLKVDERKESAKGVKEKKAKPIKKRRLKIGKEEKETRK